VPVVAKAGSRTSSSAPSTSSTDPAKYPRAFRVISTNEQWIRSANAYATKTLKRSKVALIGDTTGYGVASTKKAAALLEEQGIKPVYSVVVDPNKTSLTER
jgi:branched-chain amino acid transport system substrate-binding protein